MTAAAATPTVSRERRMRGKRNRWLLWLLVFTATFLVEGRIFRFADWAPQGPLAWALSLLPLVPGALAFRAFVGFFREADEMVRAMLTEGLLFGFAVTMIFWGAIQVPEHVWLPKVKADILMSVLLLGFTVGMARAQWRRK
jgi:hypothetical protein